MPSSSPLFTITLLRHGESHGNAQGIFQGQVDFDLTDRGRQQAQALGEHWQCTGINFQWVISSPQSRALQTAKIVAGVLDLPVETDRLWMERNAGRIQGLTTQEADEKFPRPDFVPPFQPIAETGESLWEVYLRAGTAVQALLRRPPGRYLVVAHGAILNMVMYVMLGIVPQPNQRGVRFRFRNTSFAELSYNPQEHVWILESFNDLTHLKEPCQQKTDEN